MANFPPWPVFARELRAMGKQREADLIEKALRRTG